MKPAEVRTNKIKKDTKRTDHINKRILHSDSEAQAALILETSICRILMFRWSFRPLYLR